MKLTFSYKPSNEGIGLLGAITLCLIFAKLAGWTTISWWLVTFFMWIGPVLLLIGVAVFFIGWTMIQSWKAHAAKKRRKARSSIGS